MKLTEHQQSSLKALVRKYGNEPTRQGRDGKNLILHFQRPGESAGRMYRIAPDGVTTPV